MEEKFNRIKNKIVIWIFILLIVILIIGVVLFVLIISNNNNESYKKNDIEKKSQIEDTKNDIKVDYTKIDLSKKNDSNSCGDNAYYIYDNQTHTVTIIGYGVIDLTKAPHYVFENIIDRGFGPDDYDMVGELIFPSDIEKIIISEGITEIRNKCGSLKGGRLVSGVEYEKLKEVVLPNSIEKLGEGCFAYQTNLEKINIPDSIKVIPGMAFYNCKKINRIDLPEGVETIGYSAFENCNKLYYINFPNSIRIIQSSAFNGCATLPEVKLQNVRYIGISAFSRCYNLKSVEINGDIPALYTYTFDACLNLTNVKLSKNIKYIAKEVWRHSNVLEEEKLFKNRKIIGQLSPTKEETNEFEYSDIYDN